MTLGLGPWVECSTDSRYFPKVLAASSSAGWDGNKTCNESHFFSEIHPSTKEFVDNLLGIAFESDVPTAEFVQLKGKRFRIERVQATLSRFQTGDSG